MRRPFHHLSDDDKEGIRQLCRNLYTKSEIMRMTGRSSSTVNRVLRASGDECVSVAGTWTEREISMLGRFVADDFPMLSAAELLERSEKSVRHQIEWNRKRYDRAPHPRRVEVGLRQSTYAALEMVAREIAMTPIDLARVLLRICERENLFAWILNLDGQRAANDEVHSR